MARHREAMGQPLRIVNYAVNGSGAGDLTRLIMRFLAEYPVPAH